MFKVMDTLTSKSLPEWSSGTDAAIQELGSRTHRAVQTICTDVGMLAERVAVLEYRGEKFPGWVSEEISRQLLPLIEENRALRKACAEESAGRMESERRLREYLSQRDVAQQEQIQGVTNDLSTKNAHLYGAFADVSRRLEELQISQRGMLRSVGGPTSMLTIADWGKGLGLTQANTGPAGGGPVLVGTSPPLMGKGGSQAA